MAKKATKATTATKAKPVADPARELVKLQLFMLAHTQDLRRVSDQLIQDDMQGAVKALDGAVGRLDKFVRDAATRAGIDVARVDAAIEKRESKRKGGRGRA